MKKSKIIWIPASAKSEDITDDQYFQEEPWASYISNSKLGLVDPNTGGNIALFLKSFNKKKRSKAFQTGTIVHSLLLQENDYGVSDVLSPGGKLGDVVYDCFKMRSKNPDITIWEAIDISIKYHDYYKGKLTANGIKKLIKEGLSYYYRLKMYKERVFILTSEDVKTTLGCLESLKQNDQAMEILFPQDQNIQRFNEMAIAADVLIDDKLYTVKIKVDNWSLDINNKKVVLNDFKTSGSELQNFVDGYWEFYPTSTEDIRIYHPGSFAKYKYYRQLALYAKILCLYVQNVYGFEPIIHLNIVAVETKEPYLSKVFNFGTYDKSCFTTRQLVIGLEEAENLLTILKEHNYEPTTGQYQLPQAFV